MRLRVIGCHGGESPTHRMPCFQIDEHLFLDTGALTRGLSVVEQRQVDQIYVSHSHLDHIGDLATLADNVIGQRDTPVEIYCMEETADAIEKHFLNNVVWPDFTKIPNPANPDTTVLRMNRLRPGDTVQIGKYSLRTIPVNHPVPCHAVFVNDGQGTLVYSSDTGPTEALWDHINAVDDLKAFIYEVSFPNNMEKLAHVSGHLTPKLLAEELQNFNPKREVPIYLYGMKPNFTEQLKEEVGALQDERLVMLKPMDEFDL